MTLFSFVFFLFGILSEIIFLLEAASPHIFRMEVAGKAEQEKAGLGKQTTGIAHFNRPAMLLIAGLAVLAALVAGLLELFGAGGVLVYIDSPVISFIFVLLGLFVLAAALLAKSFLPPVNEQSILVALCLVLVSALWGERSLIWLPGWLLTVVPAVVALALLIWRRGFSPLLKAVLYLWYLLSLMVIPFQSGEVAFFHQLEFNILESYSYGILLVFLLVHCLFAVRFFLIASSILVPRNRRWVSQIMPQLFTDEQVPLTRFLPVVALIAILLLVNQYLGLLTKPAVISLCMVLGVQLLSIGQSASHVRPAAPAGVPTILPLKE